MEGLRGLLIEIAKETGCNAKIEMKLVEHGNLQIKVGWFAPGDISKGFILELTPQQFDNFDVHRAFADFCYKVAAGA